MAADDGSIRVVVDSTIKKTKLSNNGTNSELLPLRIVARLCRPLVMDYIHLFVLLCAHHRWIGKWQKWVNEA
jgi:hypothetical protein